jgi:hypothetical protein
MLQAKQFVTGGDAGATFWAISGSDGHIAEKVRQ